jgi:DNA-directed RNA polymerase specialized sigma24 family protein
MARLLNTADAEEVTQEVFLRAYERLGELRAPTDSARG